MRLERSAWKWRTFTDRWFERESKSLSQDTLQSHRERVISPLIIELQSYNKMPKFGRHSYIYVIITTFLMSAMWLVRQGYFQSPHIQVTDVQIRHIA